MSIVWKGNSPTSGRSAGQSQDELHHQFRFADCEKGYLRLTACLAQQAWSVEESHSG
jgi:hypothetical protein